MRTNRKDRLSFKRLAAAALALVLVFAPAASAAAQTAPATVRAGYFYNGDFMHKNDDGSYAGYDVEYYYALAGYADWNVRFVEYDSLKSALAALKSGEIDVMSGLSKTPKREADYLVSAQKMCTSHIAVQTRADDDRFAAGDTAGMAEMRCGILRGSNVVTLYSDWCLANGLTPHIVEYDSLDQRNAALAAGEVDAIAGGSTIPGAQKIAEFPSLDLYFMFSRDRSALKTQLDRAMSVLSLEDPSFSTSLYATYFPTSRNSAPSFSAAEKSYIAAHPSLRAAVLADDAPFSSGTQSGQCTGILPEYFAHLSSVIGAEIVCVPFTTKAAALEALRSGKADLLAKDENDLYAANTDGVLLTVPYLKMNLVQITQAGTQSVASAAVPACNAAAVSAVLAETDAAVSVSSSANSLACFRALRGGRVDSVVCTQPAATWLLSRSRASDYVVTAFGDSSWDVSCALPSGADGNILRSILNKTVAVDNGYINQLITSDTLADSAGLAGIFDRLPVRDVAIFAVIAAALLAVTAAALFVIVRRRRAERELAGRQAALTAEEETARARRAFFGTVSHDMRTPLNGIVGFTALALESDDPAEVRAYLHKIRASGAVLSDLVSDTLILSRIENGKYNLKPEPTDMAKIFEEVLGPIRALAEEKGVVLRDNGVARSSRPVLADRLSVEKVLLNLLTNAVKFTPAGGTVSLDCRLEPAGAPDAVTVITVSDTGVGIAPEFLPHVFDPFSQEDPLGDSAAGSGMGLSIARSIVGAMGGTLEAASEKSRGSVFTVCLPFEALAVPVPAQAAAPDESILNGRRVLVCEDNELNLEILGAMLEGRGMAVSGAENGRLGVDAFAASAPGTFDAVLLDLRMPVMDGKSAARAIRALDRPDAKTVPIFAVSADAFPEDVADCLAAGMDGHLAKPVDAELLFRTLAAALASRA